MMAKSQCPGCSQEVVEGAKFCQSCGTNMTDKKPRMTGLTEEGQAIVAALNLSLGGKIDKVGTRVDKVETKVEEASTRIDDHEARLKKLEAGQVTMHGQPMSTSIPKGQRTKLMFFGFPDNLEKATVEAKLQEFVQGEEGVESGNIRAFGKLAKVGSVIFLLTTSCV